jgi:signal transduction histidine kinase
MDQDYRRIFSEEIVPQVLKNGRHHGTVELAGKGGAKEYLEFRSVLRQGDSGEPLISSTGRFVTGRITAERELRSLKEQLVQAQKMEAVGTLTSGISHDFNNLLQAIIQPIQLALKNRYLDYKERRFLDIAVMSARRGADLVQQLLTFSRKMEPQLETLNLPDVVEEAVELLKKTFPRNIRIRTSHGPGVHPVSVDPVQVRQMILNLGVNARDAMPGGGSLAFETLDLDASVHTIPAELPPGGYSLVRVSDSGAGIPDAVRSKIFEPFFTTKDKSKNTGLGLSMVYGAMKTHGGAVTCESTPGKGSVFTLYFPSGGVPDRVFPPSGAEDAGAAVGEGRCVLLVEDEAYIREIVVEVLRMSGYTVLEAADGREALEVYAGSVTSVDMVILDLNMPVMGGRECLVELLKMDPEVRIIVATGSSDMDEIEEIRGLGARGIITKPYTSAELLRETQALQRC